jgi:hypothetical protein
VFLVAIGAFIPIDRNIFFLMSIIFDVFYRGYNSIGHFLSLFYLLSLLHHWLFGVVLEHFWCWFGAFIYSPITHLGSHFLSGIFCTCFVPFLFRFPYTKEGFIIRITNIKRCLSVLWVVLETSFLFDFVRFLYGFIKLKISITG